MKQISLPLNLVLEKFQLKLAVRSRSVMSPSVTSLWHQHTPAGPPHEWTTITFTADRQTFLQTCTYISDSQSDMLDWKWIKREGHKRLWVCSNLIEYLGNMASHRSRGSGSSSSRTHSVIYRPPNFISRGIVSCIAGGWDKKRGERGEK